MGELDSIFALHNRVFELARDYKSGQKKGEVRMWFHHLKHEVLAACTCRI